MSRANGFGGFYYTDQRKRQVIRKIYIFWKNIWPLITTNKEKFQKVLDLWSRMNPSEANKF